MPLGPWAIAKRSLRIQIVVSNTPQHLLLDGVMDKALSINEDDTYNSKLGMRVLDFPIHPLTSEEG